MHHRELEGKKSAEKLNSLGLSTSPDLSTFIENLEAYRNSNPSIYTHTNSLVDFLGYNSEYYDIIFDISDSKNIEQFFSQLTGEIAKLPRKQTGGPSARKEELSQDLLRYLRDFYHKDYEVFGKFLKRQLDENYVVGRARKHKAALS